MGHYKYDFSVIMAVYNVESYLREAVESLVHQTIGFSRIQLILVDDGSTDKSGKICDKYRKKYPGNVVVVHKKNGGVSSARNAGLPYIKGRYLNFMDSDDIFARDAFEKVFHFFSMHEDETDVVAVPMVFFDGQTGGHQQNSKFFRGKDILDLFETTDITNMNVNSSFIKAAAAEGKSFDTELKIAEDAKFMLSVLTEKMKLGLVGDTKYWYRKRSGGEESAIQSSARKQEWYVPSLKGFSNWALDTAGYKYAKVPKFVQHTVMYDLQWKLQQNRVPEGVLSEQEREEYEKLLFCTVCRIDDDVILQQENISADKKLYFLQKKNGIAARVRPCALNNRKWDLELWFGDNIVGRASEMKTVLEFIRFDFQKKICTLEGYHVLYGIKGMNVEPCLLLKGKAVPCITVNRERKTEVFYGEQINDIIGFKGTFSLNDQPMKIGLALKIGKFLVKRNDLSAGDFFPVCCTYRNSYCVKKNYMVTMDKAHLSIRKKPVLPERFLRECFFLAEIWRKNCLGGRKAVGGRLYYHLLKPFKKKHLWIVSDRIMKADDNGEALFRYLRKTPPSNTRVVFAVSKNSPDYERMKKTGPCVGAMSYHHKLLHLLCDVNISSHADAVTVNPYSGYCDALRDLLSHQHFVFLQHGVTKDDISGWLNRYNKDISGFVTAAVREHESIVNGNYGYPASRIWLTGFPRYDRLYHREENVVTVMPTWRRYLMGVVDGKTGRWTMENTFRDSSYYQFYDQLLNSPRLLSALKERNCRLQFFPHPNLQSVLDWFHNDPRVTFLPAAASYREVYAQSRLVITDYSSAVFDFAYLRKPVLYCQFDKEDFFSGAHTYEKGYFDYERDGFGEVTYDLETLTDLILQYADSGFSLKDVYRERIDTFFAFHDQDSCRRVTEKILALPEKI